MPSPIYVAEISYYDDSEDKLYFATGKGLNGEPTDTPAHIFAEPRIINPGNIETHLFQPGTTLGKSEVSFGEIRLNNADGALDDMRDYGYDRTLTLYRGNKPLAYPGGFTKIFTGTVRFVEYSEDEIILSVSNRQAELYDLPIVEDTFSGDTSDATYGSGAHVNGTEDDLQGKNYPWVIGNGGGENWSPPMVNASKQTFMVSKERMNDDWTVWMAGVALVKGTNHSSITALQAATVASGEFDYYLGDGGEGSRAYFRVGSTLGGKITMKGTAYRASGSHTAANCCNDIFTEKSETLDSASRTALDTANSSLTGYYVGVNGERTGEVLDVILTSIGGAWYSETDGTFKVLRLVDPSSGTSVKSFHPSQLLGDERVRRIAANDPGNGSPCSKVVYQYNRNYTRMNEADSAGIVASDPARVQRLKEDFKTIEAGAEAAVLTKYPKALPFYIESYLTDSSAATTEAGRQADLREVAHDHIEITVDISDGVNDNDGGALNLGEIVTLEYSRYSTSGSDKYVILGIIADYEQDNISYRLWRPRT